MLELNDERAVQAVKAALRWMKIHNVQWLKTEEKIYSLEHNYAGTMDGLAYTDSCDDLACCPEPYKHFLSLVDWKTSNQLKDEYCLQTSAYQHALAEELGTVVENRWVLRLGKSEEEAGKFEPWFLPASTFAEDFSGFLACLRLTRIIESISERMSKAKGKVRAIKKVQRETEKALLKEAAKLQKALDKAAAKVKRAEEKARIKAEAKVIRDGLKAAKKLKGVMPVTCALMEMLAVDIDRPESEPLPEGIQPTTEDVVFISGGTSNGRDSQGGSEPGCKLGVPSGHVGSIPTSPTNSSVALAHSAFLSTAVVFEEEVPKSTYKLPMEGD